MHAIQASLLLLAGGLLAAFAPTPVPKPRKAFAEHFTLPTADVTKGYRSFEYEATVRGSKADVAGGRLSLRGDNEEGDQRLFVTSRKVFGKAAWPDTLEVTVKLGGTGKDNVGWHVGVSVGRVKVLFHPNYEGGAFRAETIDTHQELFANQNLGFTPAPEQTHPMTLKVTRSKQGYRFEVELKDAKGGGKHRTTFDVTDKQMGSFDRVGLERSGRRGGDALFESLTITQGK